MAEDMSKKRRKAGEDDGLTVKAAKWADEFDALDEDDQYTYLEELAPRISKMHLQFLQGVIGFEEDEDGEDDEEEFGEDGEEDGEEGEEGEEADEEDDA